MGAELSPTAATARATGCPGIDLVALTEGRLAGAELERALAHIDGCEACAAVMSHLATYARPIRCGRYELSTPLGQGGMGTVYAAWDPQLHRRVAVKLVRPEIASDSMRQRMLREARALARVSHPNVIAVYDAGDHEDELYIATELVEGDTLTVWQRDRSAAEVVRAWLQVARGLAAAHAEDVVHRDVKPDNCLVGRDGRVRVGDFGLARTPTAGEATPAGAGAAGSASPITQHGQVAGTPAYMAPEQKTGEIDPRSDQYSLAVALVEALTARRPGPDEAPELPSAPAVAPIVARALHRDPDQRFPSMDALADALAKATEPSRRGRRLAIAGLVAALGAAAAIAVSVTRPAADPATACAPDPAEDPWAGLDRARIAAATPANVPGRVDAWRVRWQAAARASCAPGVDAKLRTRRASCLRDELAAIRTQLLQWTTRQPLRAQVGMAEQWLAVQPVHVALDDLPDPEHCTREAWLPPELSPARSREVAIARFELAAALALPLPERRPALERLVPHVRALAHAPLISELARRLSELQIDDELTGEAEATRRAAVADAERLGDRPSRLRAAIAGLYSRSADDAANRRAVAAARAELAALGGDPRLEADLELAVGHLELEAKHIDEAVAAFERARAHYRTALGPGSATELHALMQIAAIHRTREPFGVLADRTWAELVAMGKPLGLPIPSWSRDPKQRLAAYTRMLDDLRAHDPDDLAILDTEYDVALASYLGGDPRAALAHFESAVTFAGRHQLVVKPSWLVDIARIRRELGDPRAALEQARAATRAAAADHDDESLGRGLVVLGDSLVDLGRPREALESLKRALDLGYQLRWSAKQRGEARFSLARATWAVDPRQGLALANVARGDLEEAIAASRDEPAHIRETYASTLRAIDAWIKKRER